MVGKGGNLKVFLALNNLGYTHNSAFLDFNIFEGNVHVGMRRETVNDAKSRLLAILGLGHASSMAPRTPPLKRSRVVASSEGDPSRTSSKKPRMTPSSAFGSRFMGTTPTSADIRDFDWSPMHTPVHVESSFARLKKIKEEKTRENKI